MTITFVGAGAPVTGNNASLNPGVHASTTSFDLVILVASIRNSGVGTVDTPTGWTRISGSNNLAVFGRIWSSGYTAPTVSFTGGVANADTLAQTFTLRGTERTTASLTIAGQLNGSAQNVAYAALNMPTSNQALILAAWKQDDATSYTAPAGFTGLTIANSTAGDDASQALFYQIQTTETDLVAGNITVTGGAAAISRSIAFAVRQAATLTAIEQDSWPPRVLVSLENIVPGDQVAIYRVVNGQQTLLRGGAATVTDIAHLVVDAELPFGVPVSYLATVNGTVEYTTSSTTYQIPGGKVALTDAITGASAEVVVAAWDESLYDRQSSLYKVGGRNVVVTGEWGQFEAAIEFYVENQSAYEDLMYLFANATEGVIQIRVPDALKYPNADSYVAILRARARRWSQDGSDNRRIVQADTAETESWSLTLEAKSYTYADLEAAYTGLTYADLEGDYATYLDLAKADLS